MAVRSNSPLRYPGGKSTLYGVVAEILRANDLRLGHYCEPYAGGCGLALSLLFNGDVSDIHINDLDRAVWSFWDTVLNRPNELNALVEATPITLEEWERQRGVYLAQDDRDPTGLGFSMFFLNRTNRSGVIKSAGVIGGRAQKGNYTIDCRFNRQDLVRRITRISKYSARIHLYNEDAVKFMKQSEKVLPEKSIFCIDPPYFSKGSKLYTNFYAPDDHKDVAKVISSLKRPWIVTYDDQPEIRKLYSTWRRFRLDLNYSLQEKRVATELFIASKGLRLTQGVRTQLSNAA